MESMKHSTKSANPIEALAAQNEAIKKAVMEESLAREKVKQEDAVKKAEEEAEELAEALRKIQENTVASPVANRSTCTYITTHILETWRNGGPLSIFKCLSPCRINTVLQIKVQVQYISTSSTS